jgi:hypothetical protein
MKKQALHFADLDYNGEREVGIFVNLSVSDIDKEAGINGFSVHHRKVPEATGKLDSHSS